jgi:hypothetical protein
MSSECDRNRANDLECAPSRRNMSTIDHPDHYQGQNLEAIDVIEAFDLNFSLGNAIKYILRAGRKGVRKEDLEKAVWYINREIDKSKC